jgi:hypothetical protein
VLASPHHHHIVTLGNTLNLLGDLVREAFLQLQAVGKLMGDPGKLG